MKSRTLERIARAAVIVLLMFFFAIPQCFAMFCTKCGVDNPDNANFCYKCGTHLYAGTTNEQQARGNTQLEIGFSFFNPSIIASGIAIDHPKVSYSLDGQKFVDKELDYPYESRKVLYTGTVPVGYHALQVKTLCPIQTLEEVYWFNSISNTYVFKVTLGGKNVIDIVGSGHNVWVPDGLAVQPSFIVRLPAAELPIELVEFTLEFQRYPSSLIYLHFFLDGEHCGYVNAVEVKKPYSCKFLIKTGKYTCKLELSPLPTLYVDRYAPKGTFSREFEINIQSGDALKVGLAKGRTHLLYEEVKFRVEHLSGMGIPKVVVEQ